MVAERFGTEKALLCERYTGKSDRTDVTFKPGDEVICHPYAHIYNYEGGGIAANAHASVTFTGDNRGIMHPEGVLGCIKADDVHYPKSRVLALKTPNKGGGTCYEWEEIRRLEQ